MTDDVIVGLDPTIYTPVPIGAGVFFSKTANRKIIPIYSVINSMIIHILSKEESKNCVLYYKSA